MPRHYYSGLGTLEGEGAYGGQISYISNKHGISFTYGLIQETPRGGGDVYVTTNTALKGFFSPEANLLSIIV